MAIDEPFDIQDLTPLSDLGYPREVTPIAVRELRDLRLKEAVLEEVDVRLKPLEDRLDRIEEKQDAQFATLLTHVTRKSVLETLAANTKAVVVVAIIVLVIAVTWAQADFNMDVLGMSVDVAPLED